MTGQPVVLAVSQSRSHRFSKTRQLSIRLVAGLGVDGDCHAGTTVKHRSRVRFNPAAPNLRQVHLIHQELLDDLNARGFSVGAGDLGENILTRGIDLLSLSTGTRLYPGPQACIEITGLRNPCIQLDRFQSGLTEACLIRHPDGRLTRLCGVMGIVIADGEIQPGDPVRIETPVHAHRPLAPV